MAMSSQTSQNLVSSFQIFASARIVRQPPSRVYEPPGRFKTILFGLDREKMSKLDTPSKGRPAMNSKRQGMNWLSIKFFAILSAGILVLSGCGGDGGDSPPAPATQTVSGVTSGTITQKGSIFINGIELK